MARLEMVTVVEASAERPRHDGATIVELRDGRLLMAWMEHTGGKEIGHDHAPGHIASMLSSDGGRTWGEYRVMVANNPQDVNIHFPCLLRLQNGDILFFYQRRHELATAAPQVSTGYVCRSADEGRTFSTPREHELIRRNDVSANCLIQLSSGRIILPLLRVLGNWCEVGPDGQSRDTCISSVSYSDDNGMSWQGAETWVELPRRGAMEAHVAELKDGRLLMTLRTQLGAVFQSESRDQGITWSKPQTTGLRAPESMPTLAHIPDTGDLMLVWNHSLFDPRFDHCGKRTPLTVAVSRDDGASWERFKNIESDPEWEYTNSAIHFTSRGVIITYVASKMDNPEPPGRLGRSRMPLRAAIADIDWLYT